MISFIDAEGVRHPASVVDSGPDWSALGVPIGSAMDVRDSIGDMLEAARCWALGVGLLSGGYCSDELRQAGATAFAIARPEPLRLMPASSGRRRGGRRLAKHEDLC